MSDLALIYTNGGFDLDFGDGGAAIDDGLRTAVIISLFSDRRAGAADALPDGSDDRRGWWGDIDPEVAGDLTGSRLWLLSREKQVPVSVLLAETYAKEGLQWMLDDGVATTVEVDASNPANGVLGLAIHLQDPSGVEYDYQVFSGPPGAVVYIEGTEVVLDESGFSLLDESGEEVSGRT